jgi:starch-binding outer membrane protein, SusD/RagB family
MKILNLILFVTIGSLLSNCHQILDIKDLSSVDESDVWNDNRLAVAYSNRIYEENLPVWSTAEANMSDESAGAGNYMYGQLTENSVNYWPYAQIRKINILLAEIDGGAIDQVLKNRLKGEAYFFRAWQYFELMKRYGGVPLILEPQRVTDDLLVPRSPTSTVLNQIISDLDEAINLLPTINITSSSAGNDGHVHKGTAKAVKGRVLLYYASPQFNPGNEISRWQAAYEANLEAKNYLEANGFGLFGNFANIWFDEMNREAIFVTRYAFPVKTNNWAAATRPLDESQGTTGGNRPTLEMVKSFPMADGRPIEGHPDYNETFLWQNRDPRFASTIVYNGSLWELSGKTGRIQWTYVGGESNNPTPSGFYMRKAIDVRQDAYDAFTSTTYWIELRFAEVLMNLAEAANAIGETNKAYDQIKAIRARAGIGPGTDNMYGLEPGMSKQQMQNAIMLERKIEFAYEAKRHWDLRRNRLFESELNNTRRHGYRVTLKSGVTPAQLAAANLDEDYDQYFNHTVVLLDLQFDINWKPEYYFYAIPATHLERNSNLEQTKGWAGGTFDPLL